MFSGVVLGLAFVALLGSPANLFGALICLIWAGLLIHSVYPFKYNRGHRSHDNMGHEYEVRWPLLFGYYWCREIGSFRGVFVHESVLA